ncbi:MAG: hypothetical protein OHK0022_53940 [Roseiflexaceae bacterium]
MRHPLVKQLDQLALERWARQGLRTVLRALWLGVCVWCIGLGGHLVWGWPLRYDLLAAAALGLLGIAVLSLLRRRMAPREVARRLDRRFHLDEQLATALELPPAQPSGSIGERLLAESSRTVAVVQRRIGRQQQQPWSEVLALLALTLVLIGLLVLTGIGRPGPGVAEVPPLPVLLQPEPGDTASDPEQPPPPQPNAQQPGGQQPGQQPAAGDPSAVGALADALRGQGATRPAAEALDRGDLAQAAQELRELADQADQLSQSAREDLADRLRDAANQLQNRNPDLAEQLRDSADNLERGGAQARDALDDLARAIEGLGNSQPAADNSQQGEQGQQGQQGQDGQQGQQGQQQNQPEQQGQGGSQPGSASNSPGGEQRQSSPPNRLGVEGQPLPLEAEGEGQQAERQSNRPATSVGSPSRSQRESGTPDGSACSGCADPLRVPVDERDVVQDYFSP